MLQKSRSLARLGSAGITGSVVLALIGGVAGLDQSALAYCPGPGSCSYPSAEPFPYNGDPVRLDVEHGCEESIQRRPAIVFDENGTTFAAYLEGLDQVGAFRPLRVARRTSDGGVTVNAGSGSAVMNPVMARFPGGELALAYAVQDDGIYLNRSAQLLFGPNPSNTALKVGHHGGLAAINNDGQIGPAVAALPGGQAVAAWVTLCQGTSRVMAARVIPPATLAEIQGSELSCDPAPKLGWEIAQGANLELPSVVVEPRGTHFWILWRDKLAAQDRAQLVGRRFDSNGVLVDSRVFFEATASAIEKVTVAARKPRLDGSDAAPCGDPCLIPPNVDLPSIVAAYQSGDNLFMRRFKSDGTPFDASGQFLIRAEAPSYPRVDMDGEGNSLLTWSGPGGVTKLVRVRVDGFVEFGGDPRFTCELFPHGAVFQSVAANQAGNYVAIWEQRTSNVWDIWAQYFGTPSAASISPTCASTVGGRTVTITGSGFSSHDTVTLAGTPAFVSVSSVSPTSITATVGPRANGPAVTGDVVITRQGGLSSTIPNGFTYAVRGDANNSGSITASDTFYLNLAMFLGGPMPATLCNGDANGNGATSAADAFFLKIHVFLGGAAPPN